MVSSNDTNDNGDNNDSGGDDAYFHDALLWPHPVKDVSRLECAIVLMHSRRKYVASLVYGTVEYAEVTHVLWP